MATIVNARDVLLQAASTRVEDVTLPSNYDTSGDHTGTLSGSNQTNFQNSQITLSSNGILQNAGGGQITNGASIGSLNAGNITTGTLSASRIGASTIDASKLNVSTLSAITANLGTVTAGSITSSADINISGRGTFNGSTSIGGYVGAVHANDGNGSSYGLVGFRSGTGACVVGSGTSGASGIVGQVNSTGAALVGIHTAGGTALQISSGVFITNSSALVNNLRAERATTADSVLGSNVSGTVASATNASNATNATNASNSNSLGGVADSGWCRGVACDVGTATASAYGFGFISTVSGTETAATGANNYRVRSTSDRRKKTDIQPEVFGLDFINKLTPVSYRWKKDLKVKHHGLIAQDVEPFVNNPDDALAITYEDGVKGVDYISMVGVLIKAVQELTEEVNQLKEKIK